MFVVYTKKIILNTAGQIPQKPKDKWDAAKQHSDDMMTQWPFLIILAMISAVILRGLWHFRLLNAERTIRADQIQLMDVVLSAPCAFFPRLHGKIINKSQLTLTEVFLKITIFDGADDQRQIIERKDHLVRIDVPPGAVKNFLEYIRIAGIRRPTGRDIFCQCDILYAKGK